VIGVVPRLVVHHCGEAVTGPTGAAARVAAELRLRWPDVRRIVITDEPANADGRGNCCLPQAIAVDPLRAAVSALLAGGQLAAGSER
jgi:hypothetical protein